jgi:tetratricopeptide (TPR) repeat protein
MAGNDDQVTVAADRPTPTPSTPPTGGPPAAAPPPAPAKRSLYREFHRRGMFKAAVSYVFAAFAVMGGAEVTVTAFDLPKWVLATAVVLATLGFPVSLFLNWQAYDSDSDVWTTVGKKLPRPSYAMIGLLAVLAVGTGVAAWKLWPANRPPPKPQTVLIADLENRTGEAVFEGTLEPALGLALEGASFITTYRRDQARKIADQLKLEGIGLDEKRARLVAQREGLGVVTSGFIEKREGGYRVGLHALDAFTGTTLVAATEDVPGREAALTAATKLAAHVRKALGDATPVSEQMKEGETFSARSIEAAHDYAQGMNLQWEGKYEEAKKAFLEALRRDPSLGRAYTGLAVMEKNRGHRAEAERYFKQAMAHLDRISEREKLRNRAAFYLYDRDPEKSIEVGTLLVTKYPADTAGLGNLGVAYQLKRDFPKALEYSRRAIAIYPNNVPYRNNVGLFAMFVGDFDGAIKEQKKVLELSPGFVNGYKGLALAQLGAGQRDAALATWNQLAALSPDGASEAAEGLADLALLEGRTGEARTILQKGIEADVAAKDEEAAARKQAMLGMALVATPQGVKAGVAAADRARQLSTTEFIHFEAGMAYAMAGEEKKAVAVADDLDRRLGAEPRMYADVLRGTMAMKRRNFSDAVTRFKSASAKVDAWITRYALGRAYLEAGAFAQAQEELETAARRRGEAADVFLETVPSYRLYGDLLYYLARTQEALKSPGATETYKAFLAQKKGTDDPLIADARRRVGGP